MLKATQSKPLQAASRSKTVAAALALQLERLLLLVRALRPTDSKAREIIWASLRRRVLRRWMVDDDDARRAYEIDTQRYQDWIGRFDKLTRSDEEAILHHVAETELPVPLVVFLFDAVSAQFAAASIQHLRKQLLSRFDALLCFSRDCRTKDVVSARKAVAGDTRFTVSSELDSRADEFLAERDCILLAEGGVLLREHALYMFVLAAGERHRCLIYSDEDHLDTHGLRRKPRFKPTFSPELLHRLSYLGPCAFLRGVDFDASEWLCRDGGVTRCIDRFAKELGRDGVESLPFVLYHDARRCRPRPESVEEISLPEKDLPPVSIIIPTKDKLEFLEPCLASIESRTRYPRAKIEIVVVDNGSKDPATLGYLGHAAARGEIRLLRDAEAFNYSRINNFAASHSKGDVLVFLNNDTTIDEPRWLEFLVSQAMQEDVGAVGAKLLYPDRTVQFAGTIVGLYGVADHAHVGLREDDGGYCGVANVTREVTALTGACLALRRKIFEEVGGFDTALAVGCSDVLLCAELTARGYRNLCLGLPLLIHHESKTRGRDDTQEKKERALEEGRYLRSRYKQLFQNDPYYSPNLSYDRPYDLAFPPRRQKPWRRHLRARGKLRILILGATNGMSKGLPAVLRLQATHMARLGHEVFIAEPCFDRGVAYEGCKLVQLKHSAEAAVYAVENDVDCIMALTDPYFSVVRWIGNWPSCVLCDYDYLDSSFYSNSEEWRRREAARKFYFGIADHAFAISSAVPADMKREGEMKIISVGNSHLTPWSTALSSNRERTCGARRWQGKVVMLNVCRGSHGGSHHREISKYAAFAKKLRAASPGFADRFEFVLCVGALTDVGEREATHLSVFSNVNHQELIDIYAAADIYVSCDQEGGYNLGFEQALALGLPVVTVEAATDQFEIIPSDDASLMIAAPEALVEQVLSGRLLQERTPKLRTWEKPLSEFAAALEEACRLQGA